MTIGHPDLKVSYPERQALYPVSVRHNNSSPTASFRFPVSRDTLAFDYKIPVITALLGLGGEFPLTLKTYYMPGTLLLKLFQSRTLPHKHFQKIQGHIKCANPVT